MDQSTKFQLALIQIDNLSKIVEGNEYERFLASHLSSIKIELERQLSHLNK
jgi:hypothetical protein